MSSLLRFLPQDMVNCNNIGQMPDVTFHIQGQEFTLPSSAYIRQVTVCLPVGLICFHFTMPTVWLKFFFENPP